MPDIIYCQCEGLNETFGKSVRGDEISTAIMDKLKEITDAHEGVYVERTGNRYLLHAQVGASNSRRRQTQRTGSSMFV